jgi:carbonic anhydrase/acetyltransferase-like protein (isoleucine patch superfamily)
MKVADSTGAVIEGLYRTPNNGLVVKNPAAYQKYLTEKQRIEKLHSLEEEVSEMKTSIAEILRLLQEKQHTG